MAKPRRRRMGRYIRGDVDETLLLTTLGSKTGTSTIFDNVVNECTLVSSLVASYSMSEFTVAAGVGPILVGVCHSDYSIVEIEEFIEATLSWSEADLIAREVGSRKIRKIGIFDADETADVLNDGKMIKTKLNWIINQGQSLKLWGYNTGSAAVVTTVPVVELQGHANLFPR